MGLILTATAGLCLWIILWAAANVSGFDAMLIRITPTSVHSWGLDG